MKLISTDLRTLSHHHLMFVSLFQQQENKMRVDRGEAPLPEDDIHKMFKPPVAPARLDSLLLSSQISAYASQMSQFSSQTFGKLFMVDSLQETNTSGASSSATKST